MSHVRPARRRIAAAAIVVLAVTAGPAAPAGALTAAPSAPGSETAGQTIVSSAVPFPVGHTIEGVTEAGYLTERPSPLTRSWVRASDGAVTALPDGPSVSSTGADDLLALSTGSEAWLQDAPTGEQLFKIRLGPGGGTGAYAGAAGRALFTTASRPEGGIDLRMHTEDGVTSTVIGFPRGVNAVDVSAGTSTHALLTYRTLADGYYTYYRALIDLATGAVTETGVHPDGDRTIAVSPTHVAWVENSPTETSVMVRARATGDTRRVSLGDRHVGLVKIGLTSGHLIYGSPGGLTSTTAKPLSELTAYDLETGAESKLLDHFTSFAASAEGVLYARGGTVAEGEGLYRIGPGTSGGPGASLVATTGEPTKLALVGHDIPETIDLGPSGRGPNLTWTLSRSNATPTATLRHVRTGKTAKLSFTRPDSTDFTTSWAGDLDDGWFTAYNGDYVWEFSAVPKNGIGPALTASGTFKVVRSTAAPHDFNDNGTPDLLAREADGRLWRADSHQLSEGETKLVGGGWNAYDQIEATGDIGGAATGDLVARDKDGVLWLYLGKGEGTFATRSRVGGGWGVYGKIAVGSDVTNDGRADLLATDKNGTLWLYKGTGDWRAPFAGRVEAGTGYGAYNQITATGDIGGAAAGDLIARDTSGVLWLHLGKGDGTFAARTRIGSGWDEYGDTVGIGDANHDGHPDLYAGGTYAEQYFYPGTGDWRAPFAGREATTFFVRQTDPTAVS
ncbi:FG-GAP repeat domain-containing protein [Streptomyces parvulus]|uniref:FG-GAP repeat domain-containing protein n=1 Tax=Streptomyces parvulus TaxID=146923 RepID=UPI0036A60FA9